MPKRDLYFLLVNHLTTGAPDVFHPAEEELFKQIKTALDLQRDRVHMFSLYSQN